jgi:8-oxo-dGTP diphosphatase
MTDNREYPDRPFCGVGAVILKGDQALLIRRGKPPRIGQWSIPGGIQHVGETWREAVHREVSEETGLTVEIAEILAVVDSITRDERGQVRFHYTLIDVLAQWRAGEPNAGSDAAEARWVPLSEVDAYGLWSETTRILRLAAERRQALGSTPRRAE